MAANFLGLFLLIIAGISNAIPFSFVVEKNIKDDYYPWPKDYVYKLAHDFPLGNYFRSLQLKNRGRFFDTDKFGRFDYVTTDYETTFSDKLKHSSPSNVYSKSSTGYNTPSATANFVSDLSVTSQKDSEFKYLLEGSKDISNTKITSNPENFQTEYKIFLQYQPKSSSFVGTESTDLTHDKIASTILENSSKVGIFKSSMKKKDAISSSEFLTDTFTRKYGTGSSVIEKKQNIINGLFFPTRDSVISYTSDLETKEECRCSYHNMKTSSVQELFKKPNKADVEAESTVLQESNSIETTEFTSLGDKSSFTHNTESTNNQKSGTITNEEKFEKESTVFQDPSSVTRKVTVTDDKSTPLVSMETTYSKDSKLESTVTQNPSFLISDEDTSSKIKTSSSDRIHSTNIENFGSETTASQNSPPATHDDTGLQSKISSSFETKSTTAEISETESTAENYISSHKYVSISFTDKVTEERPIEILTTESQISTSTTSSSIKNLVIEISSIHTARIVITSVFLVIALTALTVLAVYMFTLRRKTVHYDQLQLIS